MLSIGYHTPTGKTEGIAIRLGSGSFASKKSAKMSISKISEGDLSQVITMISVAKMGFASSKRCPAK